MTLQFFGQPEGYVTPSAVEGSYDYVYQYVDHLGNVRLSYTDKNQNTANGVALEIVEENNYYPFGLKHKGYNSNISTEGNDAAQRWKFGGKEYQPDMGLDWYDVSARNYDPALGRWMNIDPLADQMRRHSPYNYAFDNPVFFVDADGMAPEGSQGGKTNDSGTEYEVEDEYGNTVIMNSEEVAAYILANGVTDDFTFNGGGGSSSGGDPTDPKKKKKKKKITVDSKGIVQNVEDTDGEVKIVDENGNSLILNDFPFDAKWFDGVIKKDELFKTINKDLILKLIFKAGIHESLLERLSVIGYLNIAYKSHSVADFGYNQLRKTFGLKMTEYDGLSSGDGSFYRVKGENTIYNFADISQFVWGAWMRANTHTLFEAKAGAQVNNVIFGKGIFDSSADQRAIEAGYNYMNNLISKW